MDLVQLGIVVIIAGFAMVFFAVFVGSVRRGEGEGRVRGGGVLLIGPIPIVFGSDTRWAVVAIVLALLLTVLGFFLTYGGL